MNTLFWKKSTTEKELQTLLTTIGKMYPIAIEQGDLELVFIKSCKIGKSSFKYVDGKAVIEYSSLNCAARAIGCALAGVESDENISLKTFGIMLDCSRNAVMKVSHFKSWLLKLSLMGYNMAMLYTEDTYKLSGEEYFGYMRGAYTLEEIKELNKYAQAVGIKMIPCIQTLGHMEQILKWSAYKNIKDVERVLLVDCDETYALIEKMIKFWSEGLGADRINIGMDEAHGLGTGKFLEEHGFENAFDIFNRHMLKVKAICNKYGMKPMVYSDMYFRLGNPDNDYFRLDSKIPEHVVKSIPQNIDLIYWDYYSTDENFYNEFIKQHLKLGYKPVMASGIRTWLRFWCDHEQNRKTVVPCLNACKKHNIDEIYFTLWGDNGACCDIDSALAGLCWAAELVYNSNNTDELEKKFAVITGSNYKNQLIASLIELYPFSSSFDPIGAECLLWDDPLLAICWNNEHLINTNFASELLDTYNDICEKLATVRNEQNAGDMNHVWLIADFLRQKITFRQTFENAYRQNDEKVLYKLAEINLPRLIDACEALSESLSNMWTKYFKPFGLEVIQTRQGGQLLRLRETRKRILEYLKNKSEGFPELEEKVKHPITDSYGYYRWWFTGSDTI